MSNSTYSLIRVQNLIASRLNDCTFFFKYLAKFLDEASWVIAEKHARCVEYIFMQLKKIILKMAFCVLYLCAPMECIGITEVSFGGLVRRGTRLM